MGFIIIIELLVDEAHCTALLNSDSLRMRQENSNFFIIYFFTSFYVTRNNAMSVIDALCTFPIIIFHVLLAYSQR